MTLSIVIPCHGGVEDTRACLRSLLAQEGAPPLEIVVVDNGSEDGTRHLDQEFPVRVVRSEQNLGFAGGVNLGLQAASAELLMVLNNDTQAAPRLCARLVQALQSDPRIGMVAPVSNWVKGDAQIPVGNYGETETGRREIEQVLDDHCQHPLQDRFTLSGLCMVFRRSLLGQIGLFDESFGPGNYEDDDFCLRARLLGVRLVLVRNAFLHHEGHRTFKALGYEIDEVLDDRRQVFEAKWCEHPVGRAYIALMDSEDERARKDLIAARRVAPLWPEAALIEARARITNGDFRGALPCLERYIEQIPDHGEALLLRACALFDEEGPLRGLEEFQRVLERMQVEPAEEAAGLAHLGRCLLKRDCPAEAVPHLERACELMPDHAEIFNLFGVALRDAGALARATEVFRKADALGARYGRTNLGICLWDQGEHAEGMRLLAQELSENPDNQLASHNLREIASNLAAQGVDVSRLQALIAEHSQAYATSCGPSY